MIKLEHTEVLGWEHAIRGMRNPMNSWAKSDSGYCLKQMACHSCEENRNNCKKHIENKDFVIGPNDLNLMKRLSKGNGDDRKFMRDIVVYVDITAPLYWWKEFDTYKVGTVANSCSTMHKIHAKEFTLDDFSTDHFRNDIFGNYARESMEATIESLNWYRYVYLNGGDFFGNGKVTIAPKDKDIWYTMIQLLPDSYNQKRTILFNYEVLHNMYVGRKNHKLDEWRETFCDWIRELPYSEIITGE